MNHQFSIPAPPSHPPPRHNRRAKSRVSSASAILLLSMAIFPPQTRAQAPAPTGTVLFERTAPPPNAADPAPARSAVPTPPQTTNDSLEVTDAERTSLTFTAYDLDLHLTPATAGLSARAGLTLRNDGPAPLSRLVLQISSSLQWTAVSLLTPGSPTTALAFATHRVETDADHTGAMEEAVVTLPRPLAPGASISLAALYSGSIPNSTSRLERLGTPAAQAIAADWDAIAPDSSTTPPSAPIALRGFGNVLWYPVSSAPIFLADGEKFVQAIGETKLRQSSATIRLRLAVEYAGDPPDAAFFCGRGQPLTAISDNPDAPIAESRGIATATFPAHTLGFRTPSLFISSAPATDTGTPAHPNLIAAVTTHYDALPAYSAAAAQVEPLLTDWFGPEPLGSLNLLDHPGQPFEDDALLVRPLRAVDPSTLAPSLAHSLTHVWIRSTHAWIDEGLAQFAGLLWLERSSGRSAALAQLQESARALAAVEPKIPTGPAATSSSSTPLSADEDSPTPAAPRTSSAGTSLIDASGDLFYRTKAAAVWWMLRTLAGDEALKQTLHAYRLDPTLDHDPTGLQRTLEKFSHKDLAWFFNDWVYRDRGLPDLSIISVTPSQVSSTTGLPTGWLVGVAVRNDGYAAADVPVTVRSADSTETQRLRIPGRSTASVRIIFAGTPQQVQVNDGGVPEAQTSIHTRQLVLPR